MSELEPSDYATTLEELKGRVHAARLRVQRRANNELLQLWWHVGQTIRTRRSQEAWGTNVLDRLARDLRTEFPTMKGFSTANLRYMRRFAEAWPDLDAIRQRPVGELPWGHVIELLDKLDDQQQRDWYAAKDAHHGWSRPVLAHQITTKLHEREAAAPTNFAGALERIDSDQAQELTKDPYALQFLAVDGDASERELEQRMVDRILDTMQELGPGFAFVGRQVHFDIEGDALASTTQPVAVSRYELTEDAQQALPDEETIARAFADELARDVDEGDAGE